MINPLTDDLLTLAAAARLVPSRNGGRGVHGATLWRWANRGLRGVRLETVLVGGARMTTRDALRGFFRAVSAANEAQATTRAPSGREREVERAEQELESEGL